MRVTYLKILALSFLLISSFFMPFSYADNASVCNLTEARGVQIGLKNTEFLKGLVVPQKRLYKKGPVKIIKSANGLKQPKAAGGHVRKKLNSIVKSQPKKNQIVAHSSEDNIGDLKNQLAKLQKENYSYKMQLKSKEGESRIREKELQRIGDKLKLQKKLYLAEMKQKEKNLASLKLDYENRMRIMKNEVDKMAQEQISLLVEKIKIESRQSAKMRELMRIKNDLDAIIELDS